MSKDIFEKYALLRAQYPDDESIARIADDEKRTRDLLNRKGYAQLEMTQELLALCRKDISTARMKLATDRTLTDEARLALWAIVDSRLWFVEMVSKDYNSELANIDAQLEADLQA